MSLCYFKWVTSNLFLLMDMRSLNLILHFQRSREKIVLIPFVKLQILSHIEPAKFFMHRTLSIYGGLRCLLTVPRVCGSHLIVYILDCSSFYLPECYQPLFSLLTGKYIFPFISILKL